MSKIHTFNRRKLLKTGVAVTGASLLPASVAFGAAPTKVACIHGSPVENAWNSRLHVALQGANDRGEIEYVFSEGIAGTDYTRAMREYAEQGVKFIVGETFPVEKEARQVANDYPETTFLMGSSGKEHGENFGVYGTWNYDAGYLCGMLAGKMSKTGIFGSVGAIPIPEINLLINGFRAGVDAVRPDAKHLINFIGTFFDPPKAREAGLAQIDAGADILFGERIGTADAAKERGIKAIGSLTDYSERYPDTVFANALWNFDSILAAALADHAAGNKTGNDYTIYGQLAKGGSDISYNADMIPADAVSDMEKVRADIKSGAFEVPLNFDEPT